MVTPCVSRLERAVGRPRWTAASAIGVLGIALSSSLAAAQTTVSVPWRPGNADQFQAGTPEERRARADLGAVPVTIHRPADEGAQPMTT